LPGLAPAVKAGSARIALSFQLFLHPFFGDRQGVARHAASNGPVSWQSGPSSPICTDRAGSWPSWWWKAAWPLYLFATKPVRN